MTLPIRSHFSDTYAAARTAFKEAASSKNAQLQTFVLPGYRGAQDEELSMDSAYLGSPDSMKLLIVSSGVHGPEGFCGSGCQVALLRDDDMQSRLEKAGTGLLLIHAVNPYGFSHLQRTNEDNVDLNRNFVDFNAPLPSNEAAGAVNDLVLPKQWPPTPEDDAAIAAYIARHGELAFRTSMSGGQHTHPKGMFYGGSAPAWSNHTVRALLRQHASQARHVGWIDIHTGLGPFGHAEKIFSGPNRASDLARARAWWGRDMMSLFEEGAAAVVSHGATQLSAVQECPQAQVGWLGLEYGTYPGGAVTTALRASQWLIANRHLASAEQRRAIPQALKEVFYVDQDDWKGMVWGQARVAMLQAALSLQHAA
ncbi:MAG TPA: M14 family metallopeptidase [Variovorax sp.]